jgi:tetratricopeptide (TPR) repeat protein
MNNLPGRNISGRAYRPCLYWISGRRDGIDFHYPWAICREKARLLRFTGDWQGSEEIYRRNLEAAEAAGSARDLALARTELSVLLEIRGNSDQAFLMAQEAYRLWQELKDPAGLARAAGALGSVYHHRGEYVQARGYYRLSMDYAQQAGLERDLCQAVNQMGLILFEMRELEGSLEYYRQALEIAERNDDPHYITMAAGNIGNIHLERNELDQALKCYQLALDQSLKTGDKQSIAFGIGNIAIIFEKRGDFAESLKWNRRQYDIFMELGDQAHLTVCLLNMGTTYLQLGMLDRAGECLARQVELGARNSDRPILSYGLYILGTVRRDQGAPEAAEDLFGRAIALAREIGLDYYLGDYCCALAELLLDGSRFDQAGPLVDAARAAAAKAGRQDLEPRLQALGARAETRDGAAAAEKIGQLAGREEDPEQKGHLLLQAYRLGRKEEHRREAVKIYRDLAARADRYSYRRALAELEGKD